MGALPGFDTPRHVADVVAEKNEILQPDGPRIPGIREYEHRPSRATPAAMARLVDELYAVVDEVQQAAEEHGLSLEYGVMGAMTEDEVQAQWLADMANFQVRLGRYRDAIRAVPPERHHSLEGADEIYFTVTSPLLDGYFYEELPGIMLNDTERERMAGSGPGAVSNKKPPDVYVVFSLGNQVREYRKHQRERWEKLWNDIGTALVELPGTIARAGWRVAPWLVGLAAAAVAGGVIYASVRRSA